MNPRRTSTGVRVEVRRLKDNKERRQALDRARALFELTGLTVSEAFKQNGA